LNPSPATGWKSLGYTSCQCKNMTHLDVYENEQNQRRAFFKVMADAWQAETQNWTLYAKKFKHACYREALAMGWDAVPWILNRWAANPSEPWFHALSKITGEAPDYHAGVDFKVNLEGSRQAWLGWADNLQIAWRV